MLAFHDLPRWLPSCGELFTSAKTNMMALTIRRNTFPVSGFRISLFIAEIAIPRWW